MYGQENAIFLNEHVRNLLLDKKVVVLGDSIQRSVYKDLVCLWKDPRSRYLSESELRAKGELSFLGDKLLLGGQLGDRVNGIQYKEVREFCENKTTFRFYFITRCFNDYVESILNEFKAFNPNIIIMNSCYWDVHHYGDQGRNKYGENLDRLFSSVRMLPSKPLLIWNSALPLADYCKGGFLRQGFKTLPRASILWANEIARNLVNKYQFRYTDLFYSLDCNQFFTQAEDGIHWGKRAHRKISNSVLSAISQEWSIPIPPYQSPSPRDGISPVGYSDHSWPRYQYSEFEYYDDHMNSPIEPMARLVDRTPRPFFASTPQHNFVPPPEILQDRYSLHTPPAYSSRYNEHYSREFIPLYRIGDCSPMTEYYPRHFSAPLPQTNPKFRHNQYKRRFWKMEQLSIHKKKHAANTVGTPLTRNDTNGLSTTSSANTIKNTATVMSTHSSTPAVNGTTPCKVKAVDSSPELNNNNSESTDVTNDQGKEMEKVGLAEMPTRKRKREEEKDFHMSPSPPPTSQMC